MLLPIKKLLNLHFKNGIAGTPFSFVLSHFFKDILLKKLYARVIENQKELWEPHKNRDKMASKLCPIRNCYLFTLTAIFKRLIIIDVLLILYYLLGFITINFPSFLFFAYLFSISA